MVVVHQVEEEAGAAGEKWVLSVCGVLGSAVVEGLRRLVVRMVAGC
jgi:hypothetical protein